jgi:hypothetical protein
MTNLNKASAPAPAQLISSGPAGTTVGGLMPSGVGQQGPPGEQGPPGSSLVTGWWDYSFSVTPPPATGQIRTAPEPPVVGQPYTIWLAARDNDGLYWENLSLAMLAGDEIRLRGTGGAIQHCTVTSTQLTVVGPAGYATIFTVLAAATGSIAKNAKVEVALIRPQGV